MPNDIKTRRLTVCIKHSTGNTDQGGRSYHILYRCMPDYCEKNKMADKFRQTLAMAK